MEVDGATVGLAGAAQLLRIDRQTETLRQGRVVKTTVETAYLVTSLWADETDPQKLLALVRGYWAIEIKQHYRRDHPTGRSLPGAAPRRRPQSLADAVAGHLPL